VDTASTASACPDSEVLQRLVLGQLVDAEAGSLEEHLAQCDRCAAVLQSLQPSDALTQGLQEARNVAAELPEGTLVKALMQRLRGLPVTEHPGTVVGPYKLLEQIGEGGMGVVFMAEQQQPLRRKVAVKVIKPGMDSRQVIARFEAERQALALMDHPHIAHVLDAGQTPSGRPYFAMELVHGVPVTAYCDQAGLTPRERLGLFVTVCQTVQHAHHKGIIHRDVKPGNVLVTSHDGTPSPYPLPLRGGEGRVRGVVKVIDFGIAKAIGQQLTEKTLFTGFAQMIGTPMYMSPEQAGMSGLDVDTRSDIYSLGVLLYELLTGTVPFDEKRLREASYDELRRIIREEEPPRPSTRLSTLGQAATVVAAQRQSDPKRLGQLCRGELDWIVMKALEKDRNRRYETAGAFAADVQHYLDDEPVLACPPSRWYRLCKVLRKHRRALSAVALVVVALVAGSVVSTWQAIRANRAEKDAVAQRDLALTAEERARTLVGRLRTLGEKHSETRQSAYDLALALENRGDLEGAAVTYASWGFWTDAARTYRSLMQSQEARTSGAGTREPGATGPWWAFAIVSLACDDRESYRRTCQDMLDRFGDAGGTVNGARVAWVCSLQPDVGVDLKAAQKLVDPPFGDLSRAAVGALYYRTGQYSKAVEEFEKEGISASPLGFRAIVWCFQAMAYQRIGENEKAREWLAKADQVVEENRATALWNHQVLFHVIREEAAQMTGVPAEPESPGTRTRPTQADREK
jgi:serine/threonine protein kinase/tetratricopeptide (TPR) repeat protein